MILHRIAPLICLAVCACGGGDPPADRSDEDAAPQETVFDDMIEKKQEIPAAVEDAQRRHVDDTRRALDAAEGTPPAGDEPGG